MRNATLKNSTSLIKVVSKGLFIGAFLALFVAMIGIAAILVFGLANAPQTIHLSLLSQPIFDFSSSGKSFQMNMYPQGMLYVIVILMLIGAGVFWLFKGLSRTSPSQ